jgi:hypothetical protein
MNAKQRIAFQGEIELTEAIATPSVRRIKHIIALSSQLTFFDLADWLLMRGSFRIFVCWLVALSIGAANAHSFANHHDHSDVAHSRVDLHLHDDASSHDHDHDHAQVPDSWSDAAPSSENVDDNVAIDAHDIEHLLSHITSHIAAALLSDFSLSLQSVRDRVESGIAVYLPPAPISRIERPNW